MKGREIGIGPGRTYRHPGLPEALAFEGPVAVSGLGVSQRSAPKPERGDDLIPGAKLVLAPQGGRLGPEQILASSLGDGPHGPSLSNPERGTAMPTRLGNF